MTSVDGVTIAETPLRHWMTFIISVPQTLFMHVSVISCLCIKYRCFTAGATFAYDGQKPLFVELDFGIDMTSRSE